MTNSDYWRKCTTCKTPIGFSQKYWICSVSTCNRTRTDLVFCMTACFDAHVPVLNHRDAGAIEKRSPTAQMWQQERQQSDTTIDLSGAAGSSAGGVRRMVRPHEGSGVLGIPGSGEPALGHRGGGKHEILVVVSKTKDYVRATSGFNTSDDIMMILSDHLRTLLDGAIRSAAQDGRKTVLERDFK